MMYDDNYYEHARFEEIDADAIKIPFQKWVSFFLFCAIRDIWVYKAVGYSRPYSHVFRIALA